MGGCKRRAPSPERARTSTTHTSNVWLMALHWGGLAYQKDTEMHRGSCLCGKIQYRINSDLSDFAYCHCRSCRKTSGTAHGSNAGIDRRYFDLSDPEGLLREYESSPGKFRTFCSDCGSPNSCSVASVFCHSEMCDLASPMPTTPG